MVPTAKTAALPVDGVEGSFDYFLPGITQRLREMRCTACNHHRFVIHDETIACQLLFGFMLIDDNEVPQ